ncbi:hypothetical protein CPB83DRAFT_852265 [Crepidotus variabilis]|uniref:TRIP4/RQT4 C2HC5-type zinc finger domain-containing protein n=1 Tax=Crepidotus variabilis TaxID=179855 RepID=A0A9P6EI39_9AGAR|nr:hypothetical protein CPB83DRAFT_852265 [Crepidotus variabilis]
MRRTAWTKQNSSLPSDRIKPQTKNSSNSNTGNKGKKQSIVELPKSLAVSQLESLLQALQKTSGKDKDPKGGCYCLARTHPLSSYTPLCYSCGLILCDVNLPQFACPDCASALLSEINRKSLIDQVELDISDTIAKEIEDQERAIETARMAAGAFPTLGAPSLAPAETRLQSPHSLPVQQTHKVMSLTGSKNRVLVSSFTTKPPTTPRALQPKDELVEPTVNRISPPHAPPLTTRQPRGDIPFENLLEGNLEYVSQADSNATLPGGSMKSSRRRKNKGKDKESSERTLHT